MVRLYLGVGIIFVTLILIACGGGGEAQPTPTPTAEVQAPTPEPTPTPEAATPEPAVLTLAFIHDGDIWLINADGTNRRRITDFGGTDREVVDFQWLANGQEIAYRDFSDTTATSALVSLDGRVLWEVDGGPTTLWSPDGQLVAILPGKGPARIEDRAGRSAWTGNGGEGSGSWSADGSHFAIVEGDEVVVVSRDGTSVSRLYGGPGLIPPKDERPLSEWSPCPLSPDELLFGRPVFTPNGERVLIAVNCPSGTRGIVSTIIREVSLDGLVNRPVPNSVFNGLFTPPFSPDGRRMALLGAIRGAFCPTGADAFATMNLHILTVQDGKGSQLLPKEIAQLVEGLAAEELYAVDIRISGGFQEIPVAWSPASDAIVASFSATECVCFDFEAACAIGNAEDRHRVLAEGVYLLRADGVADETVADEFSGGPLSWSPSGDLIAYSSTEAEEPQIRLFDLVTRDVTDLGPGTAPAWQPLPPEAVSLPWEGAVTDNLRIRSEPNTAFDIVGTLPKGTKVRVYGEAEGEEAEPGSGNRTWYRVIGGYVYSAFVEG